MLKLLPKNNSGYTKSTLILTKRPLTRTASGDFRSQVFWQWNTWAGINGLLAKFSCNIANFSVPRAAKTCFSPALASCCAGLLPENISLNSCWLVLSEFIPSGLQSQQLGWMMLSQNPALWRLTTREIQSSAWSLISGELHSIYAGHK